MPVHCLLQLGLLQAEFPAKVNCSKQKQPDAQTKKKLLTYLVTNATVTATQTSHCEQALPNSISVEDWGQ